MVEAKIWALIYGLRLAWDKEIKFLSIETDSLQVTKWLNGQEDDSFRHYNLLVECKILLNKDVTPRPNEVHSTCNCRGAYVHQVSL